MVPLPVHRVRQRAGGFTLLEMIIAVGIVVLMAGIIAPSVTGLIGDARIDRLLATRKILTDAAIDYYADTADLAREDSRADAANGSHNGVQSRRLSLDQGIAGWDGPYVDHLIGRADNPWGGHVAIHPDDTAWLPAQGFDFDGDGSNEVTGPDLVVFYAEVTTAIAQEIDGRLDAAVAGGWQTTGQVQ